MQQMMRNEIELGHALKAERLRRGMTQAELAELAHVSRAFIIGIERGTAHRAEIGRVFRVIRALGFGVTMLQDETPDFTEALRQLLGGKQDA